MPSFDAFDLPAFENNLFGTGTTPARHFTLFGLRHEAGPGARLDTDPPAKLRLVNPMHHLVDQVTPQRSRHWWIRVGTKDSDTSLSVVSTPHARLTVLGDDVDTAYYGDGGHGADEDPGEFVKWIARVSGRRAHP
ncbi:hypothetical protein [Streptomyces chromofuscus]|uniref:Uncharacterized protein n=1 Tax=Streptomyces chromofuscus TaxID=42881 RepID=A0A7M2TGQ7_STRCW|nr:hypothetical protein [Streptomyces chromofuscus]QOV47329.1 hypothetical protein IPT68_16495 [Streptomyces chromofuscus]GGT25129.1 hypothetical protein GCM10010254_52050 [Streptomyces chromofuscus]